MCWFIIKINSNAQCFFVHTEYFFPVRSETSRLKAILKMRFYKHFHDKSTFIQRHTTYNSVHDMYFHTGFAGNTVMWFSNLIPEICTTSSPFLFSYCLTKYKTFQDLLWCNYFQIIWTIKKKKKRSNS